MFAARPHRQGERVMQTSGVHLDHQTEHSIQIGLHQHLEPSFPVRLINHSCVPNLGVRTTALGLPDFYALRDIQAGEELTFDYAMTELTHVPRDNPALEFSLHCHCGEPDCRGQLGYYSTLPEGQKRRYEGYISAYLLALEPRQPVSIMVGGLTEPTSK
ncbi:SET domain-containing protein-lysine N-methyltransferase (plasmid) [Deinococcus sp. KNUC1210]|uniref:SET domain-containing protein-lysine N-methyltransferase n=1 Tax=Deinococcus sp. KNUC1210 TaxID=2917691 RepID=UPI001EF15C32|nr:SET domain-containing protein-lysine N-methyltransferase [Deinococcus sp. KNUC1210]ULH17782.1 SET domain-containing protein-lysine N-methyltransferase [Deinococcus sp. KNUC1210]